MWFALAHSNQRTLRPICITSTHTDLSARFVGGMAWASLHVTICGPISVSVGVASGENRPDRP